jgi:hypothetical protein
MSNSNWLADVKWVPYEKGGRKTIPVSDKYAPIILISNEENTREYWSAFVTVIQFLDNWETVAVIRYLSENAPDNLKEGVEFGLFEGNKLVAKGVILKQIDK